MSTPPSSSVLDGFQASDIAGSADAYSYDAEDIREAANVLLQEHENIRARFETMGITVNGQTEGWKGASGEEFRNKLQELNTNLGVIFQWLTQASQYMVQNADAVVADDAQYATQLGSI
ncbi:WXG100 family type VII secretion target [Streptomyces sp. NPDC048629]|uniref:WXG100 family type VII secretion target n=1 Tax=Streptomyces sp. NPDC048629 TaxID=3154824 RepID=UPI00341F45F2